MAEKKPLLATARLQFHAGFTFDDARRRLPYLQALGITHVYASPVFTARAGSMHGYDVTDPLTVNPELGGLQGLRRLVAALREQGMGLIVDFVPNHMAVGRENPWWQDVLRWGQDSIYAGFFDIDWEPADPALKGRVLAPFLGKPYGEALAAGEIKLAADAASGELGFEYYEHRFALAARDYAAVLAGDTALADLADAFHRAARTTPRAARRQAFAEALELSRSRIASETGGHFERLLERHNTPQRLHALLERQHYRLAWWRAAADEINWRRFFDVIDLAGMRVQDPAVFSALHRGLFDLAAEGLIDGLRIDHIDGLADPRTYCRSLRRRLPGGRAAPLFVEKILAPGEWLPADWRTDGSTGYDFMDDAGAVMHDAAGEAPLRELWKELSGRAEDFEAEERAARRRIPQELLSADFRACALALHRIARSQPETRDYSLEMIRRVLAEVLAHFPVYRTYIDARGRNEHDARVLAQTLAAVERSCRPGDRVLLPLLDRWLGGEAPASIRDRTARQRRLRAIARFQQLTSPVAAKSVEDTAFYRHGALLSRNEVGSTPAVFSIAPQQFHRSCIERQKRHPRNLLATATHDHKRGEDQRMRLATLSELPHEWAEAVRRWRCINREHKDMVGGADAHDAPDAADEYMLYQTLAGAWPLELTPGDAGGIKAWGERVGQWQLKALREAKRQSGWIEPNIEYENAARSFLQMLLRSPRFLGELHAFVQRIAPAAAVKGLAQALLRCCAPGTPDLYQGCEFWDFSLVDPDNRRPVDYAAREAALFDASAGDLFPHWRDGRIKQQLIATALRLRGCFPDLFTGGEYQPLSCEGELCERFIAFARSAKDADAIVIAPRLPAALEPDPANLALRHPGLSATCLVAQAGLTRKPWINLLRPQAAVAGWSLQDLLSGAPVALLVSSPRLGSCLDPDLQP